MNDPFLIAIIALGFSVLASAAKLVDWFLHSDPRVMARTMRWLVIGVALLSLPLLVFLLVREQWVAAAGLVAVMVLLLPTLLRRGSLPGPFTSGRPVLDDSPPVGSHSGGAHSGRARGASAAPPAEAADLDLVRRSSPFLVCPSLHILLACPGSQPRNRRGSAGPADHGFASRAEPV